MRCFLVFCLALSNICWAHAAQKREYEVSFSAEFLPDRGVAATTIRVDQSSHVLRRLVFIAAEPQFSRFEGDGEISRDGREVSWEVPAQGGSISYEVEVDHLRGRAFDARMTENWAILRLDDLFPPARVRSLSNSVSISSLELYGPPGWRFESRYGPVESAISVKDEARRFDRPTGWMAAGELGIRRGIIGKHRVTIAAPQNQGMRRMDILAFIRWTLPRLIKAFPSFPSRLLIVGAEDGMWRGGLSGPDSLYMHPDRPLISENATSTLLHELMHMVSGQARGPKADWIIEGLAEYYSLEILRRSGGISQKRFDSAMENLADWAERDNGRLVSPSSGANTARAVLVFDQIAALLAAEHAGSLDAVIRKLLNGPAMDGDQLLKLTEAALGAPAPQLQRTIDKYQGPDT